MNKDPLDKIPYLTGSCLIIFVVLELGRWIFYLIETGNLLKKTIHWCNLSCMCLLGCVPTPKSTVYKSFKLRVEIQSCTVQHSGFILFCDFFLSVKDDVNVPSKSYKKKKL